MAIDYDQYSKGAAGTGALEGAGTGAMLGSYFAPGVGTAVGAGLGGLWGAVQGAKESKAQRTEYDVAEEQRLLELKRRMEENALGLTEEEKAYLYASGKDAIVAEQDVAKQLRESQLASAYQGAGAAFGKQVDAEKQREWKQESRRRSDDFRFNQLRKGWCLVSVQEVPDPHDGDREDEDLQQRVEQAVVEVDAGHEIRGPRL